MKAWHIITCEYPPQLGGVSDYTGLLARKLKDSGDDVHVWAPSIAGADDEYGVVPVHRWLGNFSKTDLLAAEQHLHEVSHGPRTLLVQWVPHGFGHRAMNLGFCRWLEHVVKSGDRLELMVHEPYLEAGEGSWKQRVVAQVQRRMIRVVLEAASHVYMSIPAWEGYLRPYAPSTLEMTWLPIPATVTPAKNSSTSAGLVRKQLAEPAVILGHLGTYSERIASVLQPAIIAVLRDVPHSHALLLGKNSEQFAEKLKATAPELQNRITAAGVLANEQLSSHLAACDLMLQPFPDGLSSRRTSLMNALAHGLPVVSNSGHLTEDLWEESQAVALGATGTAPDLAEVCTRLLLDHAARKNLAAKGADLYRSRFDWPNVIGILCQARQGAAAAK